MNIVVNSTGYRYIHHQGRGIRSATHNMPTIVMRINFFVLPLFWRLLNAARLTKVADWLRRRLKPSRTLRYHPDLDFVVDERNFNDWAVYRANQERLEQLKIIVNDLTYDSNTSRYQALSSLCAIDKIALPESPKVLLVGYREDTYEAQGLSKLGLRPQVEFLDLTPATRSEIIEIESFDSFTITTANANDIGTLYPANTFDLVYFSRGCLDVFNWSDALHVLDAAQKTSKFGVVAHLQSVFWTSYREADSTFEDEWLVLDLLSGNLLGEQFARRLRKHLLSYAAITGSKRIQAVVAASRSNDDLLSLISNICSPDSRRIFSLADIPGGPELYSVQLESSPLSAKKKSLCILSVVLAVQVILRNSPSYVKNLPPVSEKI